MQIMHVCREYMYVNLYLFVEVFNNLASKFVDKWVINLLFQVNLRMY